MKHEKFSLLDIIYPEINIEANVLYEKNSKEQKTEPFVKINVSEADDNQRFRAMVYYDVQAKTSADPYNIKIIGIGIFSFYEKVDIDKPTFSEIAIWNAPAIVYSSIRDFIATITARNLYGSFFLEPYVFTKDNYLNEDQKENPKKKCS